MDCMENLAGNLEYRETKERLSARLAAVLLEQRDPRALGTGDVFESYPQFGVMNPEFGGFAEQGAYNPKYQVKKT